MTRGHDIKDLLEYAAAHEPPPVSGPEAVFGRARSIQRRRRFGAGLAGGATLAVAVTTGILLTGPADHPRRDEGVLTVPAAPSATASGESARKPVLDTLRALLPDGSRTSGEVRREGFGALVVTDADGRSRVEVNVQPGFVANAGKTGSAQLLRRYDCARRTDPAGTECSARTLPDGTRVVSIDGPAGEPGAPGVVRRQADTLTAAGDRVVVTVWNAVDVQDGPVTRPEPALGAAELERIATSAGWTAATPGGGAPGK